jgi:hypothetical protein
LALFENSDIYGDVDVAHIPPDVELGAAALPSASALLRAACWGSSGFWPRSCYY